MEASRGRVPILLASIVGSLLVGGVAGLLLAGGALRDGSSRGSTPGGSIEGSPYADVEDVLARPASLDRSADLARVLQGLGPADRGALESVLSSHALEIDPADGLLMLRAWADHDPSAAAAWAYRRSPGAWHVAASKLAAEQHARRDPAAALRALHAARDEGVHGEALRAAGDGLLVGWLASGEPGVEDYIRDLGVGFQRQRALGVYARARIARGEVDALRRWAESLPDEPERFKLAAFRRIGFELAAWDPAEGVAWCERHCGGPFGASVLHMVARRWAEDDPLAALEWVRRRLDDPSAPLAIRDVYRVWLREDTEAARAFAADLGVEAAADGWFAPAAGVYASAIADERPVEALRWAHVESDAERRQLAVVTIARQWYSREPEAAGAWIEESALSDRAKALARQPVPSRYRR